MVVMYYYLKYENDEDLKFCMNNYFYLEMSATLKKCRILNLRN